ncbi:bifunctional metallophosphatase/5'-nucleotidase [soil metagenome]
MPARCRRILFAVALLPMLFACATGPAGGGAEVRAVATAPVAVPLRIVAINDFHGNLEPTALPLPLTDPADPAKTIRIPVGGAAAIAGLVKAAKVGSANTLLISSGDLYGASPLPSSLFRHETTVEVWNRIGLDINAAGNHEFDAGAAELKRMAAGGCRHDPPESPAVSCVNGPYSGAKFQYLTANTIDAQGHPLIAPYVIKEYGGIKVGIIGVVTRTLPTLVSPSGIAGLTIGDEAETINRYAKELKAQGVEAIIASLHEGGDTGSDGKMADWNDLTCPEGRGPIFDIVNRTTDDVDVFLTGHTHRGYNCMVGTRPVIQATSYGRGLSIIDLVLDPVTKDIDRSKTRTMNLPVFNEKTPAAIKEALIAKMPVEYATMLRAATPDAAIAALIDQYATAAAPKANRPVGKIAITFDRSGADSPAGRLIADSMLAATRSSSNGSAQIAFMNSGGIRTDLECKGKPPCTVTYGQAFTMMPFGNTLLVMTLTGAQLKSLLEGQDRPNDTRPVLWLSPSAGFTYTWKAGAKSGDHVSGMRLMGKPIDAKASYRVAVNSFLSEGGDGFMTFKEGGDRIGGGNDLDALLEYLRSHPNAKAARSRVVEVR